MAHPIIARGVLVLVQALVEMGFSKELKMDTTKKDLLRSVGEHERIYIKEFYDLLDTMKSEGKLLEDIEVTSAW